VSPRDICVALECAGLGAGGLSGLGGPGDLAGGLTYGPPPSSAASDLGLGLTYGPPPVGGLGGIAPLSGGAGVGGSSLGGGLSSGGLDYGPRPPMQTGTAHFKHSWCNSWRATCVLAICSEPRVRVFDTPPCDLCFCISGEPSWLARWPVTDHAAP